MIKFREKWFWALGLAVLVHVAAFLVFYLNTATDSAETSSSSTTTTESIALDPVEALPNDKVYTTTVIRPKTPDSVDDSREKDRFDTVNNNPTETKPISDDEQISGSKNTLPLSPQATDNINASVNKSTTTQPVDRSLKNPPQENNSLKDQAEQRVLAERINPDANVERIKNDAGLLDIDVPAQKSTVQIDKDYLSAKSEVEEINDRLSNAINEVKNRNQQKIDERQQLRNDALTENPQDMSEGSE